MLSKWAWRFLYPVNSNSKLCIIISTNLVKNSIDPLNFQSFLSIQPEARIHPTLALNYLHQLSKILTTLHANNIVHNDIREENIHRDHTGSLFLVNYESSLVIKHPRLHKSYQKSSMYASPQLKQKIDTSQSLFRSDVYALGMTFLGMILGESMYAIIDIETFIETFDWSYYGEEVQELVFGMLAYRESQRWTMQEIYSFTSNILGIKVSSVSTLHPKANGRMALNSVTSLYETTIENEFWKRLQNGIKVKSISKKKLIESLNTVSQRMKQTVKRSIADIRDDSLELIKNIAQSTLDGFTEFYSMKAILKRYHFEGTITDAIYSEFLELCEKIDSLWKSVFDLVRWSLKIDMNGLEGFLNSVMSYYAYQNLIVTHLASIHGMSDGEEFQGNFLKIKCLVADWTELSLNENKLVYPK